MATLAQVQLKINQDIKPNNQQLITATVANSVMQYMLTLDHNAHPGLQGGSIGERYHMTAAQYTALQDLIANGGSGQHNDLAGLQGGSAGEYYHMTAAQYADLVGNIGAYVLKTGDVMEGGASLEFPNGSDINPQKILIRSIPSPEISFNEPGNPNGNAFYTAYAVAFEDPSSKTALYNIDEILLTDPANSMEANIDASKMFLDNPDASMLMEGDRLVFTSKSTAGNVFGLVVNVDAIGFQNVMNSENTGMIFYNDRVEVSATDLTFKGLQYTQDFSDNFEALSIPHVGYVQDYVTDYVESFSDSFYLKLAGGNMDDGAIINIAAGGSNLKIDGTSQYITIGDGVSNYAFLGQSALAIGTEFGGTATYAYNYLNFVTGTGVSSSLSPDTLNLTTTEGSINLTWYYAKKTATLSGSNLKGLSLTGNGKIVTFGDFLDATTFYTGCGEDGGADTDKFFAYGQKGVFLRTNTLAETAAVTVLQSGGRVGLKNTNPTYQLDVTGDINLTGDYRKSGTIGYIVSAWGAAANVGTLVLANLRTRTLVVNGTSIQVVTNN